MSRLSLLDLAFFLTESDASPKHVGALLIFKRPTGSKADWVKTLAEQLRRQEAPKPPFNQVIQFTGLGGPSWRESDGFDIDEHLFFHTPNHILSEEQLFAYVADLHEPLLDRSKPLWECHIIDKIEGSSFAVYTKIHHAYADGITMSRWILQSLNSTPESKRLGALWQDDGQEQTQEKAAREALFKRLLSTGDHWRKVLGGSAKLLTQLALEQAGLTKNAVALPFKASEDTPLNGPMSAERQFASARISMDRIIELRASTRCTLNHIALTCIDGALRRYLHDQDIELERPLSVQMPVSLRDKNDKPGGNKVGIVLVDLAPKDSDAYTRLREIGFTLRNVRNQIDGVPAAAVTQYTIVMAAALELAQLLKLGNLLPAVADTLVSNVPGPAEPLYLKGARLEQMLPISALLAGGQLNITLYSYSGTLFFGLVATERVVQLKHLARYIQEAFDELETAVYGP